MKMIECCVFRNPNHHTVKSVHLLTNQNQRKHHMIKPNPGKCYRLEMEAQDMRY